MKDTMRNKTCLITGSSRGIGFWTAHGLAKRGAHVILIGHHQGRGEKAQSRLQETFGTDAARFFKADLSDQGEIHHLAEAIKSNYDHLDVLINNAAGFFLNRQESVDGIEMTLALNHLNYFMVTLLLFDLLVDSAPARIVNVSSDAHREQRLDFDNLQLKNGYTGMKAYGRSKLANLYFTYELDRRLEGQGITVNALHPGFVNTYLGKQYWFIRPFLEIIHTLFAKTPQEGARTSLYLASSPEVADVSGKYFVDQERKRSSNISYDREAARRLWKRSETLTGLDAGNHLP